MPTPSPVPPPMIPPPPLPKVRIRFDRHELAGAFGDLGTDIPLLVGVTLAAGLDATSVLVLFGAMQILTAISYRMPMPVQPLKAMAAIVIAQQTPAATLYGAGLAIGVVMLVLVVTGLLGALARLVPKSVVRGIQLGLGLKLAAVALGQYVLADGMAGYLLGGAAFALVVVLLGSRRVPAALPVVILGVIWAAVHLRGEPMAAFLGIHLPVIHVPRMADIVAGFLLLAVPQIPLSLGNSVLATRQLSEDLFPERPVSLRRIGWTYALMNLVNPWFGGVPTCHGSGGMAGHFAFGGRTGGSVLIYGVLLAALGILFGTGMDRMIQAFPLPVLGVLLLFEAIALIWMIRDTAGSRREFPIVILVGVLAAGLPYGFFIAMVVGVVLARLEGHTNLVHPELR